MKPILAAVAAMAVVVAGVVLALAITSPAQEDVGADEPVTTTTTTLGENGEQGAEEDGTEPAPSSGRFSFRFGEDFPAELEERLSCLADQGIAVPEDTEGGFDFNMSGEDLEALQRALEECGLWPFGDGLRFGQGDLDGFPIPDFGLPDHFGFGHFGFGLNEEARDDLASCLVELGSLESVDEVRQRLDDCLPPPLEDFQWQMDELGEWLDEQDFEGLFGAGRGPGFELPFDFEFDTEVEEPAPEGPSF